MYDGSLNVIGDLDLTRTNITALPDNLTVGGSLDLAGTKIKALPDNLTVGGSLYLSYTDITALPDNLTVGGSLDLAGTKIKALPDNLTVGGDLDLTGTKIKALFKDSRGYELHRIVLSDGEWFIAGCRKFRRQKALDHWGSPNYPDQDRGRRFVEAIEKEGAE